MTVPKVTVSTRKAYGGAYVGTKVLGPHDVIRTAVGLACEDGDLGDRCFGVGVEKFGAASNDAAPLLCGARQEARDVDERHDRNVERITRANETGALF